MPPSVRALGGAIRQFRLYLGLMLAANVSAAILLLPVLAVAAFVSVAFRAEGDIPLAMAVVVGILPSPSSAGAQFVAHETAITRVVFWRDVIDGLRHYAWPACRVWLTSLGVTVILIGNAAFYARLSFPGAAGIALIWLLLTVPWLAIHLYVFPLIMQQETPSLRLIYRNAALIALARPGFTVTVTTVWWAVLLGTSFTGLVGIFGLILCALIQQNALAVLLPSLTASAAPTGS
jgi:hypothetical protein